MGLVFFFFFQAEDGIRDVAVTGVQTCALPIYCAGRLVVDVEVARGVDQGVRRFANRGPFGREDRAGQPIRARAVDKLQRVLELSVRIWIYREDGPEQFLLQK